MSLRLKPYPAMKDSGAPWLGKVPEHWRLQSLSSLTTARTQRGRPDLPLLSVVREKGVILRSSMGDDENRNFIPDDLTNYKVVQQNDLVINKMKAWQGSLGLAPVDGIVSPAYYIFEFRMDDRRYGQALLRSKPYVAFFAQASDGVRIGQWDLSIGWMKRIPVILPPAAEQAAIVRFLDHADRLIRRYVRAKRRLIELLNEQKQAIIHQAVTRGLNPNVPLKSSGVEWLGDVPEHWGVGRLDRSITLQRGLDITKEQQVEGHVPVVSSGGILSFHNQFTSRGPGVVVGRKGTVGSVYFLEGDYWAHDTTLWVREFGGNHPKFVYYLLGKLDLKRFDTGSANPTLNRNVVHPERVAFPPVDEQRAIAFFLDQKSQRIESLIRGLSRQIDLLREYRTRLIADVVTGKLDVRGVELPPLEEAEELAPVGDEIADDVTEEIDELEPVEDNADAGD